MKINDELLIETQKEGFEIVKQILEEEMDNAVQLRVPLVIGISEGENWYQAK